MYGISRVVYDSAGFEKSLRLLQGSGQLVTIISLNYALTQIAQQTDVTWRRIALLRRLLRTLKFVEAASAAGNTYKNSPQLGLETALSTLKWSFLGIYLFLETSTNADAFGLHTFGWEPMIIREANKFWFYSISCVILLSLYHILTAPEPKKPVASKKEKKTPEKTPETEAKSSGKSTGSTEPTEKKKKEDPAKVKTNTRYLNADYLTLIGSTCDILIPGSVLGWIRVSPWVVAAGMIISSTISLMEIWRRVNGGK